ncbi:MAG: lipid A biosynthesis lauroyl acyltransferase, partial [Campylobacterota bacterium]|nr:lipid A biosynthesis lauroyl acyltransferase [Campylobacterota bacterium]
MIDALLYYAFLGFVFIIRLMPQGFRNFFFKIFSSTVYLFAKKTKNIIHINLEMAFGKNKLSTTQVEEIARYCFYNMTLWVKSSIENTFMTKDQMKNRFEFVDREFIDDALAQKKKIILISAHFGNLEVLGYGLNAFVTPMVQVARESNFSKIDTFITKSREKVGATIVYKDGAVRKLAKAIKEGKVLSLIIDQNINHVEGTAVQFFGHDAHQTSGAAFLARKFDAVVIPVAIFNQETDKYKVKFYKPLEAIKTNDSKEDIKQLTQLQANAIETIIKEDPKQWFWCHKRWKSTHA